MPCLLWALGFATASIGVSWAQHVEELLTAPGEGLQTIEGRIDWTDKTLVAYGEGIAPEGIANPALRRLMGFRAAKVVAFRNLLELIGQVRIDAETSVQTAMVANDSIRTRVNGLVRGAKVVPGSEREEEGIYRLALRLELTEEFARTVLPPVPASSPAQAKSREVFVPPKPHTGLVVDARGLDLQPSMAPRLITQEGREAYSAAFVEADYAARLGIVGYERDWHQAVTSDRLGGTQARPLIVKALGVAGRYRADLVISEEDRIRVVMADAEGNFLRQCRVIFVVGPAPTQEGSTDSAIFEAGQPGQEKRP